MGKNIIELKNINLHFKEKSIFKDLNLKILPGEKIVIRAHSGRGKSTLLKALMGFQKLDSGEIFIGGLLLNEKSVEKIREKISYLPQNIIFRNYTIKEVIENIFNFEKNKKLNLNYEKLKELMTFFNLDEDILNKEFDLLSGGERQRIALIIVFLMDKEMILMDESIASLDGVLKSKVIEYILKTQKTIILVTHDMGIDLEGFRVIEL